jgi:hypothetical protein
MRGARTRRPSVPARLRPPGLAPRSCSPSGEGLQDCATRRWTVATITGRGRSAEYPVSPGADATAADRERGQVR